METQYSKNVPKNMLYQSIGALPASKDEVQVYSARETITNYVSARFYAYNQFFFISFFKFSCNSISLACLVGKVLSYSQKSNIYQLMNKLFFNFLFFFFVAKIFIYSDDYEGVDISFILWATPLHNDTLQGERFVCNLIDAGLQNHIDDDELVFPKLDYYYFKELNKNFLTVRDTLTVITSVPKHIADSLVTINKYYLVLLYDLKKKEIPGETHPFDTWVPGFKAPFPRSLNEIDSLSCKLSIIDLKKNISVINITFNYPEEDECSRDIDDCLIHATLELVSSFSKQINHVTDSPKVEESEDVDHTFLNILDTLSQDKILLLQRSAHNSFLHAGIGSGFLLSGGILSLVSIGLFPKSQSVVCSSVGYSLMTAGTIIDYIGLHKTAYDYVAESRYYRLWERKKIVFIFGSAAFAASAIGTIVLLWSIEKNQNYPPIILPQQYFFPLIAVGFNTTAISVSWGMIQKSMRSLNFKRNQT